MLLKGCQAEREKPSCHAAFPGIAESMWIACCRVTYMIKHIQCAFVIHKELIGRLISR